MMTPIREQPRKARSPRTAPVELAQTGVTRFVTRPVVHGQHRGEGESDSRAILVVGSEQMSEVSAAEAEQPTSTSANRFDLLAEGSDSEIGSEDLDTQVLGLARLCGGMADA